MCHLHDHCDECGVELCRACETSGCARCGTASCEACASRTCVACDRLDSGCTSCGVGGLPAEYFNQYVPWEQEYRLEIGDVLEVSIFGDEETVIDNVVVAPDGYLYYGLLPGFYVKGRTLIEVKNELEEKLQGLFVKPTVVMIPKSYATRTFKVFGRVAAPGVYPLLAPTRLRQAIAIAGGIQAEEQDLKDRDSELVNLADLKKSFIARNNHKLPVDFEKLIYSSDDSNDIYLRPGDYINIAPAYVKYVYVLGNVISPQRLLHTQRLTLMGALASVGGWNETYNAFATDVRKILIVRGSLCDPCVIQVDIRLILEGQARDVYLMPGDLVFASNKKFRTLRAAIDAAVRTFIQSFATAAAGQYAGGYWFPL